VRPSRPISRVTCICAQGGSACDSTSSV
jgi:hypothetical protein